MTDNKDDGEPDVEISITGNKFSVDYCKRGTTKCKLCKMMITKGELRIGKLVPFTKKKYSYTSVFPCEMFIWFF